VIRIPCPYCGPRNSTEFRHVGEAGESGRRPDASTTDPVEWRRYLYVHDNALGWVRETWFHGGGCRRFLMAERNTGTNEVKWVVPAGAAPPESAGIRDGHDDGQEARS
jgi:sarcosine oxidase subunit delta